MQIFRTERFKKAWIELVEDEKKLAAKTLFKMETDLGYPALGVKKIQGAPNIWEARASRSLRITFQIDGDKIILRNIGKHDETLKRP